MSNLLSPITLDPDICHGQLTVRGLHHTVQSVLELLASGMTEAEILADYPDLETDNLRACQAYAAHLLDKFAKVLARQGLTDEELAAGQTRRPITKQELLARLAGNQAAAAGATE